MDDKNVIYNIGTLLSFQATDHTPPYPLGGFSPCFSGGRARWVELRKGLVICLLATPSPGQPAHLI